MSSSPPGRSTQPGGGGSQGNGTRFGGTLSGAALPATVRGAVSRGAERCGAAAAPLWWRARAGVGECEEMLIPGSFGCSKWRSGRGKGARGRPLTSPLFIASLAHPALLSACPHGAPPLPPPTPPSSSSSPTGCLTAPGGSPLGNGDQQLSSVLNSIPRS